MNGPVDGCVLLERTAGVRRSLKQKEGLVRASRFVLCAAVIMPVASAPAWSMDEMMMKKGMTMIVMPDGKMTTMPMSDDKAMGDEKMMDAMKMAKPMDHAMIMMMGSDGKMYMMEDSKMPNGMMMSDELMKMK